MKPFEQGTKLTLAVFVSTALMALNASASERVNTQQNTVSKVSYDWHSNAKKATVGTVRLSARERKRLAARIAKHGNGSYICSPSGFGRLSRCHTR
ncbi:hypothetical protein [Roseovarius sp. 2305UL8-3]|uniref:hypothetical protein n=1 Tax=Roseovarius conchicola TaxID=3121636 RepID=UPI0035293E74